MADDLANSVKTWQVFFIMLLGKQKQVLARMHGRQIMYHRIQEVMSSITIPPNSSYHKWVGVFSRLEILLIVNGYFEDMTFYFF